MKHLRHTLGLLLTLALFGVLGLAFAQTLTPAGTTIQNTATATYRDANNQLGSAISNTVTTTVQPVYGVTVEPSSNTPSLATGGGSPTDPDNTNFGTATPAYDNTLNAGSTAEFLYTVTNNSNVESEITLSVVQTLLGDDFNFENVQVFLADEFGVISGTPLDLSQPILFAPGEVLNFVVRANVPDTATASQIGLLDFVAVNDTAVDATQTGPTVSFDNNNVARVTVTNGELGLAKDVEAQQRLTTDTVTPAGNDYRVTFDFYLANTGDNDINDLSLIDNLDSVFGAGNFTIDTAPTLVSSAGGADLALNGSYNGSTNDDLLDPGAAAANRALPVGATARIRVVVLVGGPVDTLNQATIRGTDGDGNPVTNQSTDGVNPNPNTSVPTSVVLENPIIAVSKTAAYDPNSGAPFDVQFNIFVENQGDVQIQNLSVIDDLDSTFGARNYRLLSAPTLQNPVAGVQTNPNYTGSDATPSDSIELIAPGSTLNVGDTAVIVLNVRVLSAGDYLNTATASGTGPGGTPTENDSNRTSSPSADPADSEPTPISVNELNLNKSAETFRDANNDGVLDAGESVDANGLTAQPGDFIRYTITVENTSSTALTNIIVTDTIPVPTIYYSGDPATPTTPTFTSTNIDDGTTTTGLTGSFSTQPTGSTGANVNSVKWIIDSLPARNSVDLVFDVEIP